MVPGANRDTHLIKQHTEVIVVHPGYNDRNESTAPFAWTEYINTAQRLQAIVEAGREPSLIRIYLRPRI